MGVMTKISIIVQFAAILFMILFTGCSQENATFETVKRTDNQKKLYRIALEAHDEDVGAAAVRKLSDQHMISNLAEKRSYTKEILLAVIEKTDDQELIADLAIDNGRYYLGGRSIVQSAIEELSDENQLLRVALEVI